MMRKKSKYKEGKSLKTLLLYTSLVIFAIVVSLCIKLFFIVRASKFDANHHFTVSFVEENKVKQILVCNPDTNSYVLLSGDTSVTPKTLITKYFILPDATIFLPGTFSLGNDPSHNLTQVMWHFPSVKTDLTAYDLLRLYYAVKGVPPANATIEALTNQANIAPGNSLLTDTAISNENITVQVINATDTPGLGNNVSQILSLMGANIVDVSTASTTQNNSKIQYYGNESYTVTKIAKLLQFPVSKYTTQPIANIVITLGMDSRYRLPF
jgi:LytR cell envelope-related transcriptional attenuator